MCHGEYILYNFFLSKQLTNDSKNDFDIENVQTDRSGTERSDAAILFEWFEKECGTLIFPLSESPRIVKEIVKTGPALHVESWPVKIC